MPRAKAQSSLSKNQMQLAIALSSSLEESKKLELSNLTEALPASTIEDGTVPQSIKQMQKEFLDQLKVPKLGPTKKSKKPPKPVPTLLVRSSEERLRIITEKVALVLIKDDCNPSSAKDVGSLKLVKDDGQGSALWRLSWMLSSDRNLYYLDCLATFISPSEAKTGPKSNNSVPVPGKLVTPVKYRLFRSESLHHNESSQSSTYEEREISSYNEKESDDVDPDFQAQSELQTDWQRMLNNSKLSDITIVVKERTHVFAHKLVLFVRCPSAIEDLNEKNMLFWTTVAHSQAMAFLEYLYSGKLSGIRALCGNIDGVVLLAKKYKITELLKFLLISDFGVEVSDPTNCDIPTCNPIIAKAPVKSGAISPDLFADPEETIITNDNQTISVTNYKSNEPQILIEVSSDEEGDKLVKDFFGTYNPTVSSPIIKSNSEPEIEQLDHPPMGVTKRLINSGTKSTQSKSKLEGTRLGAAYNMKKQNASDSDDLFSSPEVCTRSSKCGQSPGMSRSKNFVSLNTSLLLIESSSDEELNETGNTRIVKESGNFYSTLPVHTLNDEDALPSISSKGTRKSLFKTSREKYFDDSNKSVNQKLSFIGNAEDDNSNIFSTPCTKRKPSNVDDINKHSSFYKRRRVLNKSVSPASSPKLTAASCSDQSKDFDDCFDSVQTGNFNGAFETNNVNSPKKVGLVDFNQSDYNFTFPKKQARSSPSMNDSKNERKLLDDSFSFDTDVSLLLKYTDGMQTPESKSSDQFQTSLNRVKTSSPTTPVPNIDLISSFHKRKRTLFESISQSSSPKLTTTSCSDQNQIKDFDDSFDSVETRNFIDAFETKNVNSPKKVVDPVDFNRSECNFTFPKKQGTSSPSTNDCKNERKLLDDSFNFDTYGTLLLKDTDSMQTPESKSLHLSQLRTPLDSVKTSSPVTPMPDYGAMTNEQFEVELQRFGLKRGLSRSKGIKMLTHIYGKLHPLVEVVSLDGKELLIPLGERTPGNEQSADDEPLSQRSVGNSDDNCIMLEETIFDEEEDLTQGVPSKDLKTAVRAWITSQPEIHEMILSYEPIWLDSFHLELKSQFDKRIKVNQLMDVLDEEGITFRSAPGQQNRTKKRNSPKKKLDSPRKLHASPKKKLPCPD